MHRSVGRHGIVNAHNLFLSLRPDACPFGFRGCGLKSPLGFHSHINGLCKSFFVSFIGDGVVSADVSVTSSRLISEAGNGDAEVVLGYFATLANAPYWT